jgi:homocysteine S-methyltransferase
MKKSLLETLEKRVLLTDGGMGMELYSRGFFTNRCYDELNLSSPQTVAEIHGEYAKAGAEILIANTLEPPDSTGGARFF